MTKASNTPPEDLEYSNLFADLAKRKQPTKLVDFPVYDEEGKPICQVVVRTLTHDDHIEIQKAATLETDRIYKDDKVDKESKIYKERHDNITSKHFIFRACRDPENITKPFFPTPDHVGKHLSNDEIALLLQHYQTLQSDKGPLIAYMDDDRFEAWINKLAQSAEEGPYFLDRFLPEAKNQFLLYMARQLWKYQTGKFSATLPAENSLPSTVTPS